MSLKTQKQVLTGLDVLAARAMRRATPGFRDGVVGPLVKAIESVPTSDDNEPSAEQVLDALGVNLLEQMDASALETELAGAMTQAGMIGVVSGTPRRVANGE